MTASIGRENSTPNAGGPQADSSYRSETLRCRPEKMRARLKVAFPKNSEQTLILLCITFTVCAAKSVAGTNPETPPIVVRNGRIITAEQDFTADIRIVNEKVVEIGINLREMPGDHVIDASGFQVLPGGIDPHVHLTMPPSVPVSERWVDNLTTGSRAALAGGITTVGNMSFPEADETPAETIRRESRLVRGQAIVDVFLHPVLKAPPAHGTFRKLAASGHRSVKVFMVADEFVNRPEAFVNGLREAKAAGVLTLVHCEDRPTISAISAKLVSQGRDSLKYFGMSHPVESEVIAVRRAIAMCEQTGAPVYIVHLSSERALDVCRAAQKRNLPVFVETRPLYLHFSEERYTDEDGPLYIGTPPLREQTDVDALWQGLADGTIQTVASDHAAWTKAQKLDASLNIKRARAGVNNLQVMLPMLYSEGVLQNRITLQRFVAVTSTNAAKLFGLYPGKGTIAVGSDADLVIWDPRRIRTITDDDVLSKAGFSLYSGIAVTGWPHLTIRRGEIVYQNGVTSGAAGSGRPLKQSEMHHVRHGKGQTRDAN